MKAAVGDRLVMASSVVDGPVRDGRVVEVRSHDGSPPYLVQWSDTGEETLVFPGPDTHVEQYDADEPVVASEATEQVDTWRVQVTIRHQDEETTAQAVMVGGGVDQVGATGRARRNPGDEEVRLVGDEVAVARALRQLADRLVGQAEAEIEGHTGRAAHVEP